MSLVLNVVFSVVAFVLVLGVLVIVHEFGHYLAGRLQGFGIDAFSVGFGPKVFEVKGRYNLWQFRWILMGGYVKFRGETEEQAEDAPRTGPGELFYKKPRWQRFIVLMAGVTFNLLLAYALFAGLASAGMQESLLRDQPARVGIVVGGSPADKAGLRAGDVIASVDGQSVSNWDDASAEIQMLTGKPYPVVVLRDGRTMTFHVTPITGEFLKQPVGVIGVGSSAPAEVGGVMDPSPAMTAGLKPGDKILSLDGQAVRYFDQLPALIADGKDHDFRIERDGKVLDLTIKPEWVPKEKRFVVGITPQDSVFVRYPFPSNFVKSWHICASVSTLVYRMVKGLIQRRVALSSLSGPVSIAYVTGEAARAGLTPLLWLLAAISLQLALFNILPIPALDGGQIFVLLIEAIARRDLPMAIKERILQIGFALFILLFAVIFILDTAKFFK